MFIRSLAIAALLVPALSGVASAQGGPGACDCYLAPPPAVAPMAAPELTRRLGVGLHVTSLAIEDKANPEQPIGLGGGGIQVRYRLNPRWELQLALDSLREQNEEGMPTGPEFHSATVGAMFHLRPLHRWDWYLLGAVGGIAERAPEGGRTAVTQERGRGQLHLGIGLERRWRRLGISAELRGVAIQPEETAVAGPARSDMQAPGTTIAGEPEPDSGAMATLSATYFF